MVATDSAEFMQTYKIQFGDALAPLIREAPAMADDLSQDRRLERRHPRTQ